MSPCRQAIPSGSPGMVRTETVPSAIAAHQAVVRQLRRHFTQRCAGNPERRPQLGLSEFVGRIEFAVGNELMHLAVDVLGQGITRGGELW